MARSHEDNSPHEADDATIETVAVDPDADTGEASRPSGLLSRFNAFRASDGPPGGRAAIEPTRDGGGTVATVVENRFVRNGFTAFGAGLIFYGIVQYFWPSPMGVIVQGVIIGGLSALIAFGIALIYRANRIINFAQGDLGAVPATLAVLMIVGPGVPYVLALPIGIAAAILLGALVEFVVIRRFFKAPRLILTVATLGLSQILAGMALILPSFFDITTPPQSFPSPFDFSFEIAPIIFRGNDIVAMIMIPIVIVALVAFFRYTSVGIAVRASAESSDRAFLLGIPVKRIQTYVWVIATVLASLAMFLRAGIVGLPIGRILGPSILLRALAAGVIGRMENLPTIFVASIGLGIVEQSIVWHTGRSIIIAPILFIIILGALLFQRRSNIGRAEEGSSWQAAKEVRDTPRELVKLPEVQSIKYALLGIGGVILLGIPAVVPESRTNLAAAIMIFAIIGVSLVLLTGWAGQVSLGQMAFVGIGAAVAGAVTERLQWDLALSLGIAGIAGAITAIVIGMPALRLRGLFLAVTTLAFALAASQYLLNQQFFSWWLPQERIPRNPIFGLIAVDTETRFYYLTLAGFVVSVAAVRALRRSHAGRVLIGTRENERAAQAFGISVTAAKLSAFAISGFIAAFAGGLFIHHQQSLGIGPFEPEQSLAAFTMVVIGGLASIPGALLGALFVRGGAWFLPAEFRFFTSGVGLLFILIVFPGGLGAIFYQVRDQVLRRIAARRKILVPSLIADAREFEVAAQSSREKGLEFLRQGGGMMVAAGAFGSVMAASEGADADVVLGRSSPDDSGDDEDDAAPESAAQRGRRAATRARKTPSRARKAPSRSRTSPPGTDD